MPRLRQRAVSIPVFRIGMSIKELVDFVVIEVQESPAERRAKIDSAGCLTSRTTRSCAPGAKDMRSTACIAYAFAFVLAFSSSGLAQDMKSQTAAELIPASK